MKISHGRSDGSTRRGQGTFTGVVHQDTVLENRPAIAINDNFFEPGARSYWHKHAGGQVLVVKAGAGHIQNRAGEAAKIQTGDIIYADPGEEHWHGAGPNSYIVHTAISLGPTEWGSEVTDEEYGRVTS